VNDAPNRRADARLCLAAGMAALATALASPRASAALLLGGCALLACLASPSRHRIPWRALGSAWSFGIVVGLLDALFTPRQQISWPAGTSGLFQVPSMGIAHGLLLAARIFAATSCGAWLTSTLPIRELVAALAWLRAPAPLLELLLLAHRSRHVLGEAIQTIHAAQTMRLGWTDWRRGIASAGVLAGATSCRALDHASATAEAMALRGHRGLADVAIPESDRGANLRVACGASLAIAASLALALAWSPAR
jgi:cobalt/nickel transport system permease protein